MRTYSEFTAEHAGKFFVVREGDQTIGVWSIGTAPTRFLRDLVEQAVEDGEATAQDAAGCTVTAVLVGQ